MKVVANSLRQGRRARYYSLNATELSLDALWPVAIENADAYMEAKEKDVYSYNSVGAQPNAERPRSFLFGDCEKKRIDCIPFTES